MGCYRSEKRKREEEATPGARRTGRTWVLLEEKRAKSRARTMCCSPLVFTGPPSGLTVLCVTMILTGYPKVPSGSLLETSQLLSDSWIQASSAGLYSRAVVSPFLPTASCCLLEAAVGSLAGEEAWGRGSRRGQMRARLAGE